MFCATKYRGGVRRTEGFKSKLLNLRQAKEYGRETEKAIVFSERVC